MNLAGLFRRKDTSRSGTDRAAMVARYKRLRRATSKLNNKLIARLPKDAIDEAGKRLGMLRGKALLLKTEDEMSVLMDFCVYDVRRNGRNAIEQLLIDSPPAPESDEMICLQAMQRPIYSVFAVESVLRGLGVTVRDLRSDATHLVVDMGFGSTGVPELFLAARLLLHEGFAMTSGAALPLGVLPKSRRQEVAQQFAEYLADKGSEHFDPAPLIRACLELGCSLNIQYQEPTGRPVHKPRPIVGSPTVSRNAPCPCGSGKKFKNCCMRRL